MKLHRDNARAQRARARQAGTALVLFAVLVFALLGIAALTVDMGMASLSQAQMQTAADTASLEGVRLRDFYEYRPFGNIYRRPRVSELVQQVFDDDMHPTQGIPAPSSNPEPTAPGALSPDDADQLRLGAGPVYRLTNGIGQANASATLEVPGAGGASAAEAWVDDPRLQINSRNLPSGDMLSGTYNEFSAHTEDSDYTRADFTGAIPTPALPSETWQSIGFLVRLRRTSGESPLDSAPNISSRGATLPFLFGMGTTIHAADASYNPRRDGLTLRAAAIAVGRPALQVGPPPVAADGSPLPDRIGRALRGVGYWYFPAGTASPLLRRHVVVAWARSFWLQDVPAITHDPVPQPGQSLMVRADGSIEFRRTPSVVEIVGQVMLAPCDQATQSGLCAGTVGTSIGLPIAQNLSLAPYFLTQSEVETIVHAAGTATGYIPIYTTITPPTGTAIKRIIGYGYGNISGGTGGQISITKGWGGGADEPDCQVVVAPDNASASLSRNAPQLSTGEWNQIFEQTLQLAYPTGNTSYAWQNVRPGTALAPALVR